MYGAIKSELIRIARPSFLYGGLGIIAGFASLVTMFVFTSAPDRGGPLGLIPTTAELAMSDGFVAAAATVSGLVGVVTLAFWAIAVATDYDTGLIRILTQAEPNRLRLLVGKIGALTLFTVASTFLATLVATLTAYPMAWVADISTAAWGTDMIVEFLAAWGNMTLAALVWGAVGLAIAIATRSAGIAIAAGIGYLLVVENLIGIVAEDIVDYLPGGILDALAAGGTATVAYGTALALAVLYGLAAVGSSAAIFKRREIVS